MFKKISILGFALIAITSCVSPKVYKELEGKYAELKNENRALLSENEKLLNAKNTISNELNKIQEQYDSTVENRDKFARDLAALKAKYNNLQA